MASINQLFPELSEKEEQKSPISSKMSDECFTEQNIKSEVSGEMSGNESGGCSGSHHHQSGMDSSCDSGRVSTPASLEGDYHTLSRDSKFHDLSHGEKKNNFRPWEDASNKKNETEHRVPELGLHNAATAQSAITTNPVALSGLSSHWTSLYPAFGQGLLGQNSLGQLTGQNPLGLPGLLGHVQQAQLQQQQQQLLQQFFATQQKNIQAYNAFRLQSEMKKKVERPWEQPATSNKKQSAGIKIETGTKRNHTHSHNCSDHHHNHNHSHSHSPKSSKTEKKESGNKPYKCPICDAQFNRPANLKTHLRIHSGEKPYKCDTCSARFVQVAHLRAHVLIHTGEKPYPCQVCGTRFRHLQTLKSHIRIHTGEKPFSCEECDLKFRHKSQLRLHLRTKHNINTNTKKSYTFVPGLNSADLSKIIKDSNKAETPTAMNL